MSKVKNMTSGKPMALILAYFWPVLCSTLFQQCYSLIDSIVVGKGLGDDALGAVGSSGAIMFFIFGFIMGMSGGIAILISQFFGSENYEKLRKTITMGFISCGSVALMIMLISLVSIKPLLIFLKTDSSILSDALIYIVIIIVGIPLTFLYNFFSQILNALGDSKTPFIAVVVASAINVVLDITFIMVLKMGVEGAALATLIAQLCSAIFCFIQLRKVPFLKLHKVDWHIDFAIIKSIMIVGVPVAFMNSITAIGTIVLQYFVNSLGLAYMSAYAACSKITQFMVQPSTAVGMTMNTFAGQNYGAGKYSRIKRGLFDGAKLSLAITVIGTIMLIVFPGQLSRIMLSDAFNIKLSSEYLVINGAMLWSLCFLFLVRSTCQGMGFTFVPMISGILELVARVGVVLLFVDRFKFNAIAFAGTSAWLAALILNGVYLFIILRKMKKEK